MKIIGILFAIFTLSPSISWSQHTAPRCSDVMWKRTIWRKIDLRDPANAGFFVTAHELTSAILNKATKGDLKAYLNEKNPTIINLNNQILALKNNLNLMHHLQFAHESLLEYVQQLGVELQYLPGQSRVK